MAPKLYKFRGSPPVRAVKITAKLLDLELDEIELNFLKGDHLTPDYLKLNPQHTAPTLDDNGNVICDSHAINCYLVGKYGKDDSVYPKDLYKRALVDQKLHFDLGVLFPLLRTIDMQYLCKEIQSTPPPLIEDCKKAYGFMETFLEGKEWIATDSVTLADFSCYTTISCLNYHLEIDSNIYPNITAWMTRCKELPCLEGDEAHLKIFHDFFDSLKAPL